MYIDKLNETVNEYNNSYHRTIKRKPVEVKEVYNKDPKLKVGDHKNFHIQILFCKGIYPELV